MMRTERHEFRQLVDAQLANVQWSRRQSAAVLKKLQEKQAAPRPAIPRYALVLATLVLVAGLALLAVFHRAPAPDVVIATQPVQATVSPTPTRDSRAEAVHLARHAVMEKYGLTLSTLGIFLDDCQLTDTGWVVTFQTSGQINHRLAGVYTVTRENGFISASWSHDDVDPALWQSGGLNTVAWGQHQLLYARGEGAREAMAINQQLNTAEGTKIDCSHIEGTDLWGDPLTNAEPTPDDVPIEQAAETARQALSQHFGTTWEALNVLADPPLITTEFNLLRESESGIRVWIFTPSMKLEGVTYHFAVCINAATGELERLEYTTLGNG